MFDWLKNLFEKQTTWVKQTGLIFTPPLAKDWTNEETGMVPSPLVPSGDWTPYTPTSKPQYTTLGFDSMSCATFSAQNILATMIKQALPRLPAAQLDYFRKFGFIDENGNVDFSTRFTSTMSGTTTNGNTFPNVWDSIRNQGVLPESEYPIDAATNLANFLDSSFVTSYMKARAQKFTEYFEIQYQWVHINTAGAPNTVAEIAAMEAALINSPLQIGILIPASHAEEMMKLGIVDNVLTTTFFNSYPPYESAFPQAQDPIHFSMKFALIPIANAATFPTPPWHFSSHLSIGSTGQEVTALQEILNYFGFMNVVTGNFGPITQAAVKEFQGFYGIDTSAGGAGEVGPVTRAKLNSF